MNVVFGLGSIKLVLFEIRRLDLPTPPWGNNQSSSSHG